MEAKPTPAELYRTNVTQNLIDPDPVPSEDARDFLLPGGADEDETPRARVPQIIEN